ncbi:MAG: hypothetical protein E5Y73_34455, partial [Mesorhizobium sp.]
MVEQFGRDGFPASPDQLDALTHADFPQISAGADPTVSGLPPEQPAIPNEIMEARDRAGAKRGRPAAEHEQDGTAAQRRQVEVPQRMALGPTEWLGDEHIHADYNRLARDMRQTYPEFAAQTSFVPPAVVHMLVNAEADNLQDTLRGLYVNDPGQEPRFLFLPVNNANSATAGTHWSLLFVDRKHPQGQQAVHYNSLTGSGQGVIARNLARKLGEETWYQEGQMAPQGNGYDCGVSVLEATRELVSRLANSQPPEGASLDLRSVVADRTALLARHGARPAIVLEQRDTASNLKPKRGKNFGELARDEDIELDPSDEKMEGGPDLAAIAAATPRQPRQSNAAWADALKAAHSDLSAADA